MEGGGLTGTTECGPGKAVFPPRENGGSTGAGGALEVGRGCSVVDVGLGVEGEGCGAGVGDAPGSPTLVVGLSHSPVAGVIGLGGSYPFPTSTIPQLCQAGSRALIVALGARMTGW